MARPLKAVLAWQPVIKDVRNELELTPARYGDVTLLALIHVESAGDSGAHRDGSQFWGLLQMGRYAGIDVGFEDNGKATTQALHEDGPHAIEAFLRYMERYKARHHYQPSRIAALWKGGPGTAKTIYERLTAGDSWNQAIEYASNKHGIPRLAEYVRRFTEAFQAYTVYLDDQGTPFPRLCAHEDINGRDDGE